MVLRKVASGAEAGFEAVQAAVRFRGSGAVALRKVWRLERKVRARAEAGVVAVVGKLRV